MDKQAIPVAVVQMNSTPDVERNLNTAQQRLEEAVGRGARLVVLPEHFAYLGPDKDRLALAEALPEGGPILERCRQWAMRLHCQLVLGGFPEKAAVAGKTRNTCIHLDQNGAILGVYRKIHLFDVTLPDATVMTESAYIEAGGVAVVSSAPFGGLGLSVCYDVRFPELYRELVDKGAIALAVPAAFTEVTGKAHWDILVRARAIETQCYVLAAAQTGRHYGHRVSFGHSCILDPWGRRLAGCNSEEGIALAEIDPLEVARIRREFPVLTHRRDPFRSLAKNRNEAEGL